jgi:hypothetical protein
MACLFGGKARDFQAEIRWKIKALVRHKCASEGLIFNNLSTELSTASGNRGRAMGHQANSTELGAEASFQQRQFRPRARDIIVSWTRAREYRDGEARYLQLARSTSDPDVRDRFIAIAQHYRSLAKIEQSIADQRPISMTEGSDGSSKLMRDAKNTEFDAATKKIEDAITELKAAIRNDEQQDQ